MAENGCSGRKATLLRNSNPKIIVPENETICRRRNLMQNGLTSHVRSVSAVLRLGGCVVHGEHFLPIKSWAALRHGRSAARPTHRKLDDVVIARRRGARYVSSPLAQKSNRNMVKMRKKLESSGLRD